MFLVPAGFPGFGDIRKHKPLQLNQFGNVEHVNVALTGNEGRLMPGGKSNNSPISGRHGGHKQLHPTPSNTGSTVTPHSINSAQERSNYGKLTRVLNGLPPDINNIGRSGSSRGSHATASLSGNNGSNGFSNLNSPLTPRTFFENKIKKLPTADAANSPIHFPRSDASTQDNLNDVNGDVVMGDAAVQMQDKAAQTTNGGNIIMVAKPQTVESYAQTNAGPILTDKAGQTDYLGRNVAGQTDYLGRNVDTQTPYTDLYSTESQTGMDTYAETGSGEEAQISQHEIENAVDAAESAIKHAQSLGAPIALARKIKSVKKFHGTPYDRPKNTKTSSADGSMAEMRALREKYPPKSTIVKRAPDKPPKSVATKRKHPKTASWDKKGGKLGRAQAHRPAKKKPRKKYPQSRRNKREASDFEAWREEGGLAGRAAAYKVPIKKPRGKGRFTTPLADEVWSF